MSTATLSRPVDVAEAMARQERMLADLRARLGQHCAQGVPGAWGVLCAVFGDPTAPKAGA